MRRVRCLLLGWIVAWPALAQAHFLWVAVPQGKEGERTVQVYFSDAPDAGEANLIEKISHAKAWLHTAQGKTTDVKLSVKKDEGFGLLVGPLDKPGAVNCVEASCKYGVITRGGKTSLLHYHAKWLLASPENFKSLGRAESLPLDIVPHAGKSGTELEVLWQGKPAAGSQVVIVDAGGEKTTHATDTQGRVSLVTATVARSSPGTIAIRARWVEEKPGKEEGSEFEQRLFYTTLLLEPSAKK